jgi:hypothetical protein
VLPRDEKFEDGSLLAAHEIYYDIWHVIRINDPEEFVKYLEEVTAKIQYDRQFYTHVEDSLR